MLLLSVHLGREGEPANQGEGQAASLPCRDPWSRRGQGTCRTQPRGLGLLCHLENVPAATPCLQSSQWLGAANKHPLTLGEMGKGEDSLSLIHQMFIEFLRACVRTQSGPTLYDPMDYNPLGFSVHGILQARVLEWVAISYSKQCS